MVIQCNPFVANPPIFEIVGVSASHSDLLALNLKQLKKGAKPDELRRFVFVK